MYKSAIIGSGGRSHDHIEAYKYIENAQVTACCGLTEKRRTAVAAQYGIKAYADAREMIVNEKPDMVHIITNPDSRVELMTLVSELGVPLCTVEKPVALGVEDWEELTLLEAVSKTKFAVCHQLRWQEDLVKCREALRSGKLGAIKLLDMSAGMNLHGQGTHTLDYGMSLNCDYPVTHVFANASGWDSNDLQHPAPLATEAVLTFSNNVRALWTSGSISPKCGDPTTIWQHVRVAAYAEKGRTLYEEFAGWEIVSQDSYESGDFGGMDKWKEKNIKAQAMFHKSMFEWIEKGTIPGTNLNQTLHEWLVVLAVYQSALDRKIIEMENFKPNKDLIKRLKA